MSPKERRYIRFEEEETATSEFFFWLFKGRHGVRQSCRTALAQRPSGQASQETFSGAGRGSSGARQSRTTQSPPPALPSAASRRPSGPHHLSPLPPSPPLPKTSPPPGPLP